MAKRPDSINLLKNSNENTANIVINWALTIGRLLIIIVEIVVLSALVYRFMLDSQLRGVNSQINQDQAVLNQQKKNEENYRNLQDRLALEASLINQGKDQVKTFKDIVNFAPQGMTFTSLSTGTNGIEIVANVNSIFPLSTFINSLKNYPIIDSISIDKIENNTANAIITVTISVTLKGQGGANASTGN